MNQKRHKKSFSCILLISVLFFCLFCLDPEGEIKYIDDVWVHKELEWKSILGCLTFHFRSRNTDKNWSGAQPGRPSGAMEEGQSNEQERVQK